MQYRVEFRRTGHRQQLWLLVYQGSDWRDALRVLTTTALTRVRQRHRLTMVEDGPIPKDLPRPQTRLNRLTRPQAQSHVQNPA